MRLLGITFFTFILLLNLSVNGNEKFNCGIVDTTVSKEDTLVIKTRCYDNGLKRSLRVFKDGRLHGTSKSWHKNGKKASLSQYKMGKYHGLRIAWDSTGFTILESKYNNGKLIGLYLTFYSKSFPKERINYNNAGKKHGLCETWFKNGARQDSVVYKNGVTIIAKHYYTNGKVRYYKSKCKNAFTYEAVFYNPSGKKTGEVKNGNGKYIIYAEDGSIPALEVVKDGKVFSSKELDKSTK